jgi:DNA-binding CsgD family transcriptional regulator
MLHQTTYSPDPAPAHLIGGPLAHALFDQIGSGLIVCDADGRIQAMNRAARIELQHCGLMRATAGQLQRAAGVTGELSQAIRLAAVKGRRSLVRLTAANDRLHLYTVPLPGGNQPLVLVVTGRRQACPELELELLAGSYGLTLAERRVLAGLMQESRPIEIARKHAVKLSTVRTQISSIRAKLGTRSVEGLLLRAAEVPAMPPVLWGLG